MVTTDNPKARIPELDALRGLAVIGIVWMNVYVFALPAQAYYNPMAWGGESAVDRIVWVGSFLFIEDKFRTLFAMLFGAGCMILFERETKRPWRAHFARMAVLFIIGVIHATLLANNDVLRAYAMAGLVLPLLSHLSGRALIAISIGLVALHVGAGILAFGGALLDWFKGQTNTALVFLVENNFGSNPSAVQFTLEQGRETLAERVDRRLDGLGSQIGTLIGAVPLNLAAMVLGMALWKQGMLKGEWRVFRMQRLAAICALSAIPFLLLLAWWVSETGFPGAVVGPATLVLSAPFDMALGFAYAAVAMAIFRSQGLVVRRLATVGRLSLTNYLMSSVILGSVFASWGLGLFGEVSRAQAFAISFLPIAAMLAWSGVWLEYIGQGPFERLWRAGARLLS